MTYRKKLIEVALPLEEINVASAREKSIRHGHPSTLHLWWARRPLATCRAVLFASIIDDPGEDGVPIELLTAIDDLPLDRKYVHLANEETTPSEQLARRRRYRLFTFIERLVQWQNSNDQETLETARRLILAATAGKPPPVLDPFCGGGSIPFEAQRLGLEAFASDLNPVAVLITKAMIEIPSRFAGMPPVNPESRSRLAHSGKWEAAKGLADDVHFYGKWVRDEAMKRIGYLYPKARAFFDPKLDRYYSQADVDRMWVEQSRLLEASSSLFTHPSELQEESLTVIAWLWARTVPSPDPSAHGKHVPLVRSFILNGKPGKEVWIEPVIDKLSMDYRFEVRTTVDNPTAKPQAGTIGRQGGRCLLTGSPLTTKYVREQAQLGNMSQRLLAIVADGKSGRMYLSPSDEVVPEIAANDFERISQERVTTLAGETPKKLTGGTCHGYGLTTWGHLFTSRQLVALTTFGDLIQETGHMVLAHAVAQLGDQKVATQYASAIQTYLAFAVDKMTDTNTVLCTWQIDPPRLRATFGRQALPMTWDFAEANVFGDAAGDFARCIGSLAEVLTALPHNGVEGQAIQADARVAGEEAGAGLVSTDPPYYDNIAYADLSDFFYVWLRRSLNAIYPALFGTMMTPKSSELVATPYRHEGSKDRAQAYFEEGLHQAFVRMRRCALGDYPTSVYYAFKQSESEASDEDGVSHVASTGWESMLQGLVDSGFTINGTWPTRTELQTRNVASGTNALASCIVLVCRPRPKAAGEINRREFQRLLRAEMPDALRKLTQGSIAPVDLAQAAIGPGMAVFSRYEKVLEVDGSQLRVRTALQIINQVLEEVLEEQEGWYDAETRWAVTWFKQFRFGDGPYGDANTLATAKDTGVNALERAGIVRSGQGKVRLLARDELEPDYDPAKDHNPTIWEATQYLARALDRGGEPAGARLMRRFRESQAIDIERCRDLAYRLYAICDQKKWTQEARIYNALVLSWSEIETRAESEDSLWAPSHEPANLFSELR